MANSVDPDPTAPIGAVCSGFTLFAPILNSSVMLGNYLQQTTSADDIFRCIFLGALRVKTLETFFINHLISTIQNRHKACFRNSDDPDRLASQLTATFSVVKGTFMPSFKQKHNIYSTCSTCESQLVIIW